MPFNVSPNVAEYKSASWSNLIKTGANTTPLAAQRIAMTDPAIPQALHNENTMTKPGCFSRQAGIFSKGSSHV